MKSAPERLLVLAKSHAELSSQIKESLERARVEISYCKGFSDDFEFDVIDPDLANAFNCLSYAYIAKKQLDSFDDHYEFDEVLSMFGCRHCNSARNLKKHASKLSRERGHIRCAITKIGQAL